MAKDDKVKQEEAEASASISIHGDILQAIFSHVPLIDLVPSSRVSKSWNGAVFSSLRHLNKIKPWLMVHTQRTRSPYRTTTHAYDPRSHMWIQINQPSINYVAGLRSSHSTLLYMLSPSKFSFSFDPLHFTWHEVEAPKVWRTDPIVAVVGHNIVIAGGASLFEEDSLAVDMYDLESRTWESCQSLPVILKDSAASCWLSIAVNSNSSRLYVSEKCSGRTYSFDPQSKTWHGPYDFRPDQNVFLSLITFSNNRLILVGLTGVAEDVKSVKLWEINGESLDEFEEMGELPKFLVDKLMTSLLSSIVVTSMGDFLYLHNPAYPQELVMCEMVEEGKYEWRSVNNIAVNDDTRIMDRIILSCSSVGMADLHRAWMNESQSFTVKQ